jgi:dipeptidyl aminopeptidase/acylaminoacyl peptidase
MRAPLPKLSLGITLLLSAVTSASADQKSDMARDTPVPANEQIPLVDFFRPPSLSDPSISLDGTHIAALVSDGDKHLLMVYDIATQKKEVVSGGPGDKDIDSFTWLNSKRLVFEISALKQFGLGFMAAEVGDLGNPYPVLQYYGSSLISVPPDDRTHPLVWNRSDSYHPANKDLGVAVVNTDNLGGKAINLAAADADNNEMMDARDHTVKHIDYVYPVPGPGIGVGYIADKEGKLAFGFTSDNGRPLMFYLVGNQWKKSPVDSENVEVYGTANDPNTVFAVGPREGKPRPLQLLDATTGKFGDPLENEKAYDFNGWLYRDPTTHDVIGAFTEREGPHMIWFTDTYAALQKLLNASFPGQFVQVLGSNEKQSLFLVLTYSDRQPPIYSWVDLLTKHVNVLKQAYPWIDPKRMRPESLVKYKTRDGLTFDAYLTLPAGASKQHPVPLIVLPHGGPWLRDNWGYDSEAQFLASRGYAVLKPNYRSNPGYNWMYPESDEWDFLKMHYDVTDATKTLISTGLVDPHRIAIMGGSFGGYLALMGVTNEPDLYRCAVSISGVFDWEQLINEKKRDSEHSSNDPEFNRLVFKMGNPRNFQQKFDAIAPVRHVDRIKVPVFVSHGGYDPVSDIAQSTRLISEMEKYHVTYEKLIKSEETHGMQHLDNQIELYTQIEAFLAKYLQPTAAGAATAGSAP